MSPDFDKQSYWHDRFATEQSFEWLTSSATFISFFEPYLRVSQSQRILHLGPGTSDLHVQLRAKGYTDVTNADYEPRALERGRQIETEEFGDVQTKYVVADATRLTFPADAFDIVLDKGTADAVSCGGDDAVLDMARSVRACLAVNGLWVSLSYSKSRFELADLPFTVILLAKILTPKARRLDPDVYYWCHLLRPQ